jgi:predicted Zn-dependent protease
MSEIARATSAPPRTPRTASTSVFVATLALVLIATVLLLSLDLFLARVDRRESDAHAANEYSDGLALLRAGRAREAGERFAAAVAIDRTNVSYGLALGEALLAEGRTADAEATLRALLDRAENDGAVNLTMARVMLRENRLQDAKAYFHRAIFGQWGADSVARRAQVRFELIDLLARQGSQGELLAELLPFEETPPDSVSLRHRLGHLFIAAGSPARAATIFRDLLRRDPHDADAYAGLGEAALALGNIRTGYADLAQAARLQPDDAAIAHQLAVADTALSLDPTVPRIGAHERFVRSEALLTRTMATVAACLPPRSTALSDSARTLLSSSPNVHREEIAGEAMQALASELWASRATTCAPAARDTVLRLVHGRLAQ